MKNSKTAIVLITIACAVLLAAASILVKVAVKRRAAEESSIDSLIPDSEVGQQL